MNVGISIDKYVFKCINGLCPLHLRDLFPAIAVHITMCASSKLIMSKGYHLSIEGTRGSFSAKNGI